MIAMRDLNPRVKDKILTQFAMKIPNAEKMTIDWGRDELSVYFDGIHCRTFKVSEILDAALKQINRSLKVMQ